MLPEKDSYAESGGDAAVLFLCTSQAIVGKMLK